MSTLQAVVSCGSTESVKASVEGRSIVLINAIDLQRIEKAAVGISLKCGWKLWIR